MTSDSPSFAPFGNALVELVAVSDRLYEENGGNPTAESIAAVEVAEHDDELAAAIGIAGPLYGAYVDAEVKLRSLNDLLILWVPKTRPCVLSRRSARRDRIRRDAACPP